MNLSSSVTNANLIFLHKAYRLTLKFYLILLLLTAFIFLDTKVMLQQNLNYIHI